MIAAKNTKFYRRPCSGIYTCIHYERRCLQKNKQPSLTSVSKFIFSHVFLKQYFDAAYGRETLSPVTLSISSKTISIGITNPCSKSAPWPKSRSVPPISKRHNRPCLSITTDPESPCLQKSWGWDSGEQMSTTVYILFSNFISARMALARPQISPVVRLF